MKQADLFKRGVSIEEMTKMQENIDKAHEDDTPFPVVTKDGVTVVGDVNKTEVKSHNYSIRFRFTKEEAEEYQIDPKEIIKTIGNYVVVRIDFDNVSIKPRYDLEIDAAIMKILPYFYSVNEETKKIGKRTDEQMAEMVNDMSQEIGDDLYNVVAVILGVDRSLVDHMLWNDVVAIWQRLPEDFPEVFNEAEGFSE